LFSGLFIYFINPAAASFPYLLFQTRYGTNCFVKQDRQDGARSVINHDPKSAIFLLQTAKAIACRGTKRHCVMLRRSNSAFFRPRSHAANNFLPATLPLDWTGRIAEREGDRDL